jgi:hypothetical protein
MKVKFIHLSDARGKIGGAVASKNKAGNYFRSKTSPINPQTGYQSTVRSRFSSNSKAWASLTDEQRLSFETGAQLFTQSNIFGDNVKLSGAQLFQRLNSNILAAGGSVITSCPGPQSVQTFTGISAVADVSDSTIVIDLPGVPTTSPFKQNIYATPVVSAGKKFVKSQFRLIGSFAIGTGSSQDITAAYESRFGTGWKTAGKTFYVKAKTVLIASGLDSIPMSARVVVIA